MDYYAIQSKDQLIDEVPLAPGLIFSLASSILVYGREQRLL